MPERKQRVVCNTTPLIALSIINQLPLLERLYGLILIPPAVHDEIIAGRREQPGFNLFQSTPWITVTTLQDPLRANLLSDLDRGESEVLALALETNAELVIIDERLARRHASRLGLNVTGTLGVMVRAKQEGMIDLIGPLIERLVAGGIYLDDSLIDRSLSLVGESR